MKRFLTPLCCLFILVNFVFAQTQDSPRLMVHLLSYLSQDYSEAVEAGKIINQFEYDEQVEFVDQIKKLANSEYAEEKTLLEQTVQLESLVLQKAAHATIKQLAGEIKAKVISMAQLSMAPSSWPSLKKGQVLFTQNCASCHGNEGRGDGPAAEGLNPAPSNFHDPARMPLLSPFTVYNTLTLGIEGTAMTAFDSLSEQDKWDLSFYVLSLRHQDQVREVLSNKQILSENIDLPEVAASSDQELEALLISKKVTRPESMIALIRTLDPQNHFEQFLTVASIKINDSYDQFQKQQFKDAEKSALDAYFSGIEPIEGLLNVKNGQLLQKIEAEFGAYRQLLSGQADLEQVQQQLHMVQSTINEVQNYLETQGQEQLGKWLVFGIVLREALEALLIIATILAALNLMAPRQAQWWVHGGWLSAIGLGVGFWFLFDGLFNFSGMTAENVEGVASLLAVLVLLYVGFWFHRQSEIEVWKDYIKNKVKVAVSNKRLFSIAMVSFLAVFREALETVLFLKTVAISNPGLAGQDIALGTIAAIALALLIGLAFLKVSRKIPLKLIFKGSTLVVFLLAILLTGKGVNVFQQTGLISETFVGIPVRFEPLGIFPFWESLFSQAVVITVALFIVLKTKNKLVPQQELAGK